MPSLLLVMNGSLMLLVKMFDLLAMNSLIVTDYLMVLCNLEEFVGYVKINGVMTDYEDKLMVADPQERMEDLE